MQTINRGDHWIGIRSGESEDLLLFDPSIQSNCDSSQVLLFNVTREKFEFWDKNLIRPQLTPNKSAAVQKYAQNVYKKIPLWMRKDYDFKRNYYLGKFAKGGFVLFDPCIQFEKSPYIFLYGYNSKTVRNYLPNDIQRDLKPINDSLLLDTLISDYERWKDENLNQFLTKQKMEEGLFREGSGSRVTNCFACSTPLDNLTMVECQLCGWIKCPKCGACRCENPGYDEGW